MNSDDYIMRAPCKHCGHEVGYVRETNGQNVVRCAACDRAQYNAPKVETGEPVRKIKTRGPVNPSTWARIIERDGARCVCCGADSSDTVMHVSHIISVKEGQKVAKTYGVDPGFIDSDENLVVCCEACNAGQAHRSMIPKLAVFVAYAIRRKGKEE